MNTTLLSTLSVASSGDPTVSIIKDGKIKFGEIDIDNDIWNSPEEKTYIIMNSGTPSTEIIEQINKGYLPILSHNSQVCLFKYYGYDSEGVPFVLFDYASENEEPANKGIKTIKGIISPPHLSLQHDGLRYLNYLVIDDNGDIYPLSNLFPSGTPVTPIE